MPRRTAAASTVSVDMREALLERAVSHMAQHGLADASLRSIATALGTSHRMLIYHFGSAEDFWTAALTGLRRRERAELTESAARGRAPTLRQTWASFAAPSNLPRMQLFFATYGRALAEPERFRGFLDDVVTDWLDTVGDTLRKQHRVTRAHARLQARLRLAVMRGLCLDLLTTGDRAGTTAAFNWFAARSEPAPRQLTKVTKLSKVSKRAQRRVKKRSSR